MALCATTDVEVYMGCSLTPGEVSAFPTLLAGLADDVASIVGPVEAVNEAALSFYADAAGVEIHLPSPLTSVTSVEVNGDPVTVDAFASTGVVTLSDSFSAGDLVEVVYDAGGPVPARLTGFVAQKLAAAFRATRAAHAHAAANPTGMVTSKTIGSTTVQFSSGPDSAEFIMQAGARMLTITDVERKQLRRWFDRQTTTALVR